MQVAADRPPRGLDRRIDRLQLVGADRGDRLVDI
jgi:hypothetical protein